MAKFLEDLKNAVTTGDFNSEAAKKIIEISNLADAKLNRDLSPEERLAALKTSVKANYSGNTAVVVNEEELAELNSEYEKHMQEIQEIDIVNAQLATLIEIENIVKSGMDEMIGFIEELETRFSEKFKNESFVFSELYLKIEAIKTKYKNFLNN